MVCILSSFLNLKEVFNLVFVNNPLLFQSNLSDISIDPEGDYLDYTIDSEISKLSPDPNDRLLSPRNHVTSDQASDDRVSSDFKSDATDNTKSDATDITDVVDILEDPREYEVRHSYFISRFF
jgi:hypothetical protein